MSTSIGIATGTHGWGATYQRMLQSNFYNELNIEIRFYDIRGEYEFPMSSHSGELRMHNGKSLVMIPIFGVWKYYPFEGMIENNFSPYLVLKAGPLCIFDGDEEISSFFDRWKRAELYLNYAGYIGMGVKFYVSNLTSVSASAGFDILPMKGTIDHRDNYNGFIVQIDFHRRK